jgi:NADPH-dependent ferric siderophore reductase
MSELPRTFTASTEVVLSAPDKMMIQLCDYFAEFGEVTANGSCRRIQTSFGTADLEACEACLRINAAGKDEVALAYVKLALSEHLLNFSEVAPEIVWQGDGAAGSPLPYFREMRVERVADLTPHMRRLTLSGHDLARFASGGLHVRLLIPRNSDATPVWPVMGADGRPRWPEGEDRHDVRIYTLRRVDVARGEVDIDFVMHAGDAMPGAQFAAKAKSGDIVGMTGPGGGSARAADWCLLAGDETAIPAIARILEELPQTTHAVVRIQVADGGEVQPLHTAARLDLEWVFRNSRSAGQASTLAQAVREIVWPDNGRSVFAWAGCEYKDFLAIRKYLRQEKGLTRDEHLVVAYWRSGFAGAEARKDTR